MRFFTKPLWASLSEVYAGICPLSRRVFWGTFVALNVVFAFFTAQFLWGNHDWHKVFGDTTFFAAKWAGFYTRHIVDDVFQGGFMLPVLNNVMSFAFFAAAGVMLCNLVRVPRVVWMWLCVSLTFALSPFILTRLFYTHQLSGIFMAMWLCVVGATLALKAAELDANSNLNADDAAAQSINQSINQSISARRA